MADEQSITFPEMSSKLERCCLAVAKARREQEEAEASHRAHQQQRLELERRMEEDRCRDTGKLEMERVMLDTKLRVIRQQLDQTAELAGGQGQEVVQEIRNMRLYSRDLCREINTLQEEMVTLDNIKKEKSSDPTSASDAATKAIEDKMVSEIKNLVEYNLNKLAEEQELLIEILSATKKYAGELPHKKNVLDALLKEVHDNVQGLEEDLLVKQIDEIKGACSGSIPDEEGKRYNEKMEADDSEDREGEGNKEKHNDENVDNLEIVLAEKMETLEDLQNMIESVKGMTKALSRHKMIREEETKMEDLDAEIESLMAKIEAKEAMKNHGEQTLSNQFGEAEDQSEAEDNEFEDGRQNYSQIPISERENDDEIRNIDRENYEVEADKDIEANDTRMWSQQVLIGGVDFSLGPGENVTAD